MKSRSLSDIDSWFQLPHVGVNVGQLPSTKCKAQVKKLADIFNTFDEL